MSKESARIFGITADVTDEQSTLTLYEKAEAARGPFDIVVANAGAAESAPAHKVTLDDWKATLDVNLTGAFLTVKPALAGMAKARKAKRAATAHVPIIQMKKPMVEAMSGPPSGIWARATMSSPKNAAPIPAAER